MFNEYSRVSCIHFSAKTRSSHQNGRQTRILKSTSTKSFVKHATRPAHRQCLSDIPQNILRPNLCRVFSEERLSRITSSRKFSGTLSKPFRVAFSPFKENSSPVQSWLSSPVPQLQALNTTRFEFGSCRSELHNSQVTSYPVSQSMPSV